MSEISVDQAAPTRILVLGATGMLGNAMLRVFAHSPGFSVVGTARSQETRRLLPPALTEQVLTGVDVESPDALVKLLDSVGPEVVINCVGVVKQLSSACDPLVTLPINAILPHRLARLCSLLGARLVHVSTDCVFSGMKGMYSETDTPDATDLYGRSKLLGEVDYPHAVTLRTSIVGHELGGSHGLVEWFLAQSGPVNGFSNAIFSGLPTVELAQVIRDFVIPRPMLRGVYHVSSNPVSKFDLLNLVAREYGKDIEIRPDAQLKINRSLDSSRFQKATGYRPPSWPELVRRMYKFG